MWGTEFRMMVKHEQYLDYLREAEQDRLAAMLRPVPLHHVLARRLLHYRVAHRMAMLLSWALQRLGLYLSRLGLALEGYGSD